MSFLIYKDSTLHIFEFIRKYLYIQNIFISYYGSKLEIVISRKNRNYDYGVNNLMRNNLN